MIQFDVAERVAAAYVRMECRSAGRRGIGTSLATATESLERGGAAREWSVGCSWNVWFTRAQARAYAACGGLGRKRPWVWESSAGCGRDGIIGTRWRGAAREWSVGCSWIVWFTRAQARAYSACGGWGRKRPSVTRAQPLLNRNTAELAMSSNYSRPVRRFDTTADRGR